MIFSKSAKRNIVLLLCAFFSCGILHIALYGKDFTYHFSQTFCAILTLLWMISVRKRIIDERLRNLMMAIGGMLLMFFMIQVFRYNLVATGSDLSRYLWYAMYIPMTIQPLLCFLLALDIYRPQDQPLPKYTVVLGILCALLILGVLSNDLHFWFRSFPNGKLNSDGQEIIEWLYYPVSIYTYGLYVASALTMFRKNRRYTPRKYRVILLVPFVVGFFYFVLYPLKIDFLFFRARIWQIGEMTAFCLTAALEICVLLALVPSNMGYETLLSSSNLPAAILDRNGMPVYQTAAAHYPFAEDEHKKILTHPIHGGSMEYQIDVSEIETLNQEIREQSQQIEARNAYLEQENRIKQEKAEIDTRNRLYERISQVIRPQLDEITLLLKDSEDCDNETLSRIAVLNAYIKRRSNMELLGREGRLSAVELFTAIRESLDYIELCSVRTALGAAGSQDYPARMVIAAYEFFEKTIEDNLESLTDLFVNFHCEEKKLILRMMLKADCFALDNDIDPEAEKDDSATLSVNKDDHDIILVYTLKEGGRG